MAAAHDLFAANDLFATSLLLPLHSSLSNIFALDSINASHLVPAMAQGCYLMPFVLVLVLEPKAYVFQL